MLTTTATFDKYKMRPNAEGKLLLTIDAESPTRTFYLADDRITLSESGEKFEGLVTDWGSIKQSIDIFSKKSSVGNVKIKLSNAPYKQDTSGDLSISDDLFSSKIINRTAKIYLWFEGITDLSDCLKLFEGIVQPPENVTPESLDLSIFDSTFKRHMILPRNIVNTTDWSEAPPETIGKYIPIHYGLFSPSKDDDAYYSGSLAEAIWVSPEKVVVADHVMNSVSTVWAYDPDLMELVKIDSSDYTTTLNDSGRTTITFDDIIETLFTAWIYPDTAELDHIDDPDYILLDEEKRWLYDHDSDSFMEATVASYTANGNQDDEFEDHVYGRFKSMTPIGEHQSVYIQCRYNIDFNTSLHDGEDLTFWIDSSSTEVGHLAFLPLDGLPDYQEMDITTVWNSNNLTLQDINHPNALRLEVGGKKRVGDGQRKKIGEYYDIRLKVTYKRSLETNMRIFIEGNGREFGSWIDEGGRSNIFDEGDMIENPAYIIESILRDEMGLSASDIDVTSFDDAWGDMTSWDLILSITDFQNSEDIILDICKQAKLNFFFSSQDDAKLAVIDNGITSEDDVLLLNDIMRGKIEISRGALKFLINKIRIDYNLHVISDELRSYTETENTTSQTDYAITRELRIKAKNIFQDAVATLLRNHYTGSSGFWKDLRETLEIGMLCFEKIHWEVGDVIKPDSTINDVLKKFNENWGPGTYAPLMMITEKLISKSSLKFEMVLVGDTGSGGT